MSFDVLHFNVTRPCITDYNLRGKRMVLDCLSAFHVDICVEKMKMLININCGEK